MGVNKRLGAAYPGTAGVGGSGGGPGVELSGVGVGNGGGWWRRQAHVGGSPLAARRQRGWLWALSEEVEPLVRRRACGGDDGWLRR